MCHLPIYCVRGRQLGSPRNLLETIVGGSGLRPVGLAPEFPDRGDRHRAFIDPPVARGLGPEDRPACELYGGSVGALPACGATGIGGGRCRERQLYEFGCRDTRTDAFQGALCRRSEEYTAELQ